MSRLATILLVFAHLAFAYPLRAQLPHAGTEANAPSVRADLNLNELQDSFSDDFVSHLDLAPIEAVEGLINTNSILATSWDDPGCDACGGTLDGACACSNPRLGSVSNRWTPYGRLSHAIRSLSLKRFRASTGTQSHFDRGIGYERVMYAPQVIDPAVVTPQVGFRYKIDSGLRLPDRAEYYWASPTLGPGVETSVNAQDVELQLYAGNEKLMALTQMTLRSLDPDLAGNTTGMGDMVVGAQAMVLDGKRLKLSSIMRSYLATGPVARGLGRGSASLEYGLLSRYCYSPETYWFGEFKYWTPLSGVSGIMGDVMTAGVGWSTIAMESDVFAVLPTFEMRTLSFLYGGQTGLDGATSRIDGKTAIEFYPGARFVLGPQTDLGLCELGVAAGITAADGDWFDSRWVISLRWSR